MTKLIFGKDNEYNDGKRAKKNILGKKKCSIIG